MLGTFPKAFFMSGNLPIGYFPKSQLLMGGNFLMIFFQLPKGNFPTVRGCNFPSGTFPILSQPRPPF